MQRDEQEAIYHEAETPRSILSLTAIFNILPGALWGG